MMFDLKIEASNKPGNDFILRREIGRGLYLENGPFLFDLLVVICGHVMKFRMLNHVCKLKNQGQCQSHDQMHTAKTYRPSLPSHTQNGYQYIKYHIKYLTRPEEQ